MIDAHAHIWSSDTRTYPQVPGRERDPQIDGSAERLLALMDQADVARCLIVQAPWYGEDNRYLLDTLARYPGRFVGLGYLPDPFTANAGSLVEQQYHAQGLRGVRIHLHNPGILEGVLAGRANPLIQACRSLDVPVQFLCPGGEYCHAIIATAKHFPDVRLIIDHMAHPKGSESPTYESSRPFFACADFPNVYVKVSMHYLFSRLGFPWRDLSIFQKRTLESFGANRLMWGSNYPMQMEQASYPERLECVRAELSFLSDTDRQWILSGTSQSIWRELQASA